MGKATDIAINDVSNVPLNKGRIPKCFSVNKGVHWVSVKKSTIETSLKNRTASTASTETIPMVTNMVIRALENSAFSMISSFILRIIFF